MQYITNLLLSLLREQQNSGGIQGIQIQKQSELSNCQILKSLVLKLQ